MVTVQAPYLGNIKYKNGYLTTFTNSIVNYLTIIR